MKRKSAFIRELWLRARVMTITLAIGGGLLYLAMGGGGIDSYPRLVVGVVFALAFLYILLNLNRRNFEGAVLLFVFAWTIATRGMQPVDWLTIFIVEVLIWALFFMVISSSYGRDLLVNSGTPIPVWLWIFLAFWIFGIGVAISTDVRDTEIALAAIQIFSFIPALVVAKAFFKHLDDYWRFTWVLSIGAMLIDLLGMLQYAGLVGGSLLGLPLVDASIYSNFNRYSSLWGYPYVGEYLVMILPLFLFAGFAEGGWRRWYFRVVAIATIVMIFLSGTRNAYIGLIVMSVTFVLFSQRRINPFYLILIMVIIYLFVDSPFAARLNPLLTGDAFETDTSLKKRLAFYDIGFSNIVEHPLTGVGVGASGWTHNSFLMIFQSVGIIGGLSFVLGYLSILHCGFRKWYRSHGNNKALIAALVSGFLGFLVPLNAGQPLFIPPQAVPFWFFCGSILAFKVDRQVAQPPGNRDPGSSPKHASSPPFAGSSAND